jgi:acyl-CoA thioesterase-1
MMAGTRAPLCALACAAALALGGCAPAPEKGAVLPAQPPRAERHVVVFLGDSLTAGLGVDPTDAYPALIGAYWKEKGIPYVARNAGVSGDKSADVLKRLNAAMGVPAELAVLAIGSNDAFGRVPVEAITANLRTIIARVRKTGSRIVLSPMYFSSQYLGGDTEYTSRFNAMYAEVGKREGVRVLPPLLRSLWSRDELWLPDNMHPTVGGHAQIARDLLRDLNPDWSY